MLEVPTVKILVQCHLILLNIRLGSAIGRQIELDLFKSDDYDLKV